MNSKKNRRPGEKEEEMWFDFPEVKGPGNHSPLQAAIGIDEGFIDTDTCTTEEAPEVAEATTAATPPTVPCIFPNLMPLATPTIVRIPPNLLRNLRVLPMVLACNAASRGVLELFGPGVGMPVTVLMGPNKHASEDFYALGQIHDYVMAQLKELGAPTKPVRLLHHTADRPRLNEEAGRSALQGELPAESILIIYDLAGWFGTTTMDSKACSEVVEWLTSLCAQGHTPVVFEPSGLGEDGLFNLTDPDDVLEIDHDPGAPNDDGGGGCIIRRERRGIFDEFPLRWNFWYRVQEGHLRWGMEVRDDIDDDALSEHERKTLLRQINVAKGMKRGISQKKLAEELQVSASTICRDVKELQKAGSIP
jgi:hypothetical protein